MSVCSVGSTMALKSWVFWFTILGTDQGIFIIDSAPEHHKQHS